MTGFHDHGRDLSTLLQDAMADVEPTDRLAEIRQATASRRPRIVWFATGGTMLAAAAAVTTIVLLSTQTSPTADDDADPLTPSETAVAVYYRGDTAQGPRLYREFHRLTENSPASALAELSKRPDDTDYGTFWQPGQLLGAYVDGDVIKVEVDVALTAGPVRACSPVCGLDLQQVIYTVQAAVGAATRMPVQFVNADGNPVAEVLGVPTSEPLTNDDPLDVLSLVSISDPVEGLVVTDSFIARGAASSFEGNVPWKLKASDGTVVREGFATAGMDVHLLPWETEPIDVSDLPPGKYTFAARTEGMEPFIDTRTVVVE